MPPTPDPAKRFHKPIRLPKQNYIGPRAYFLTLCTRDRMPYFRSHRIARWILESLQQTAAQQSFTVRAYCLMPDHLHALVQGDSRSANLLTFVKAFKHKTTFHFRSKTGKTLWQISFFDHILRTAEDLSNTADYILSNPVRAGLVRRPNEYPHSQRYIEESRNPARTPQLPAPCTFTSNSANFCFRSAWSFPLSASASCVMFIEQNFGPHIEQNFASL
jgi:REP-associated tyrosine transposase